MGRPKKEKPNHATGMYEVKVTIGHTTASGFRKRYARMPSSALTCLSAEDFSGTRGSE